MKRLLKDFSKETNMSAEWRLTHVHSLARKITYRQNFLRIRYTCISHLVSLKKYFLHTYSWRHCKTHIKYNLIKGTFTPNHFNSGSTCIINILRTYLGIKNSHEHIQWTTKNGFTLFYGEWRMTERQVVGEYEST